MMDQPGFFRVGICVLCLAFGTARAEETGEQPADGNAAAGDAAQPEAPTGDTAFTRLVRVTNIHGACDVSNPDNTGFEPAVHDKYYPMGTRFRTGPASSLILVFSAEDSATLEQNSDVTVLAPKDRDDARMVQMASGKLTTTLRENLAEGLFTVETPNTVCRNMAGRGVYTLTQAAEGETFLVATITGSSRIEGPQYHMPALRAANTVEIHTEPDRSLSRLTGISGDFSIILENGTENPVDFSMTPKAVVKIWREHAPVGGRQIISTLVVTPTGIARHRFAYAVGRDILTTGELISPEEVQEKEAALPLLLTVGSAKAPAEDPPADQAKHATEE